MAEQKHRVVYYLFGICVYGRREFSAMNLKHLLFFWRLQNGRNNIIKNWKNS